MKSYRTILNNYCHQSRVISTSEKRKKNKDDENNEENASLLKLKKVQF